MKNKIVILIAILFSSIGFFSCEDPVLATMKESVDSNELSATSSTDYVLTLEDAGNEFEEFKWTAPDYGFQASVTYTIQIDHSLGDFSNPIDLITVNDQLSVVVKVSALNEKLLALNLTPEEASAIKVRVVSVINNNVAPVISNEREINITPYATSFPPIYGMGDALKGWGPWPTNAIELQSPSFQKYETTTLFTSGKAFRFFKQLDWGPESYNYPFFTSVDPLFENAMDGDSNLKFIGATGYYKISVDLKTKSVTMEAVSEPVLYMTGAAINGWNWNPGTPVKMTYLKPGVFESTTTFSNETFRFFGQADWGPTSYNYPFFTTVDAKFENADDGDKNLRFVGTPGSYKITVDLNAKTVVIGDKPKPKLFMTGAALNGWSWDEGTPVELTYISENVYEATATFTSGEAFRFFAQKDWGPTSYNYPFFTTVDPKFENANDGDSNLKYIGTTGSVTIQVNLLTKVVTVK